MAALPPTEAQYREKLAWIEGLLKEVQ